MNGSIELFPLVGKIDSLRGRYDWIRIITNEGFRSKAKVVDRLLSLSNQSFLLGYEHKAYLYYAMAVKTAKKIGMLK